tara:strand:+ start:12988 stop:13524 length:537 start_codon:yes stop_codon:yes gene_type:complete
MYPSNELVVPNQIKSEYLLIDTRSTIGNTVTYHNNDNTLLNFRIKLNEMNPDTNYTTTPGVVFHRIQSIELSGISFSHHFRNDTTFSNTEYIIIDIEELNGRIYSNNEFVNGTFAIVYLEDGKYYHKGRDFFEKTKVFNPPLTSLSALNVKILNPNNDILSIPTGGSMTMMFKINTVT